MHYFHSITYVNRHDPYFYTKHIYMLLSPPLGKPLGEVWVRSSVIIPVSIADTAKSDDFDL